MAGLDFGTDRAEIRQMLETDPGWLCMHHHARFQSAGMDAVE